MFFLTTRRDKTARKIQTGSPEQTVQQAELIFSHKESTLSSIKVKSIVLTKTSEI